MSSLGEGYNPAEIYDGAPRGYLQDPFPVRPIPSDDDRFSEASGWDTTFYYLGKPEEWLTKTIGNVVSEDPKYDFGTGSPGNQVLFADLYGDAFEGVTGDRMPLTSAILGLGTAIVNPLDPLNKLKLFSLTEKGIAASRIEKLRKSSAAGQFFVKGKDNLWRVDSTAISQARQRAVDNAKKVADSAADGKTKLAAQQNADFLTGLEKSNVKLNQYLEAAQKDGMSIDDIALAPTRHAQYAAGQRRMFGFSSPLKFDHLSLFNNLKDDPFDAASRSLLRFGTSAEPSKITTAFDTTASRLIGATGEFGKQILAIGGKALSKVDYVTVGERYKPVVESIDRAIQATDVAVHQRSMMIVDAARQLAESGVSPQEFNHVIKEFYKQHRQLSSDEAALLFNSLESAANDIGSVVTANAIPKVLKDFKVIRQADRNLLDGVSRNIDPNTGNQILSPSTLSRAEADEAIDDYLKGGPSTKIGGRPARLTGKYVAIQRADMFDPQVLDALKGVEGAIQYEVADISRSRLVEPNPEADAAAEALEDAFKLYNEKAAKKEKGYKQAKARLDKIYTTLLEDPSYGLQDLADRLSKLSKTSVDDWTTQLRNDFSNLNIYDQPLIYRGNNPTIDPDLNSSILLGRRPLGGKVGIDPIDPDSASGVLIGPEHIYNLEVLAAQLTSKGLVIDGRVSAADFLFTDDGLVYLTNPGIIQKTKKFNKGKVVAIDDTIAAINKTQLQRFQNRYEVGIPIGEPSILDSKTAIRTVASNARVMRRIRNNSAIKAAKDADDVFTYNAYQLLREANNTTFHEQLLFNPNEVLHDVQAISKKHSRVAMANQKYIADKINDINSAVAAGKPIPVDPIEVGIDELGRLQIVRGRNDLVAAILTDQPLVNVKVRSVVGEVLNPENIFVTRSENLTPYFHSGDPTALIGFLKSIKPADPTQEFQPAYRFFENGATYKLYKDGKVVQITPDDFKQVTLPQEERLTSRVASIFSQIAAPGSFMQKSKESRLLASMWSNARGPATPEVVLAERIAAADNLEVLRQELSLDFKTAFHLPTHLKIPSSPQLGLNAEAETILSDLKEAAKSYLEYIASKGIFTDSTRKTDLINKYDGIIHLFETDGDTLRIIGQNESIEKLNARAGAQLNQQISVEEFVPYYKISLENKNETVVKSITDYHRGNLNKLASQIKQNRDLRIPEKEMARLKSRKIMVNPKKAEDLGLVDGRTVTFNPDELRKKGFPGVVRRQHAFYYSDTGALFVDIQQNRSHNVANLLDEVFGEARVPRGDFGYVTPDYVVLHFGMQDAPFFSKAVFNQTKARLHTFARRMIAAGYDQNLKVAVELPMYPAAAEKMFPVKDMTLGQMAADLKGLNKDEWIQLGDLENAIQVTGVDNVPVIYQLRKGSQGFKYANPLYTLARDYAKRVDDLRMHEIAKAINTPFHATYVPRVRTADGDRAMALLREETSKYFKDRAKVTSLYDDFMRGRTLPDLTTPEINELITRLRTATGSTDITTSSVWNDIVTQIGKADTRKLHWLASMMDEAGLPPKSLFFEENPLYAELRRVQAGAEVLRRRALVDELAKHGAVVRMNKSSFPDWQRFSAEVEQLQAKQAGIADRIKSKREDLDKLQSQGSKADAVTIQKIQAEIADLERDSGTLISEILKYKKNSNEIWKSPQTLEIDPLNPTLYIKSEDARELVAAGKLAVEDVARQLDAGLVSIPASRLMAVLPDDKEILLFPKEAQGLIERYLGSTRATSGRFKEVVNFIDAVQDAWRSWTLFPIPSYHARNFISNAFLLWLGGRANIDSINQSKNFFTVMAKFNKGVESYANTVKALKESVFTDTYGNMATAYDIWQAAIEHGVFTGGLHFNEFRKMRGFTQGTYEAMMAKAGAMPSSELSSSFLFDNKILRGGKNIGQNIENWFRMSAFIEAWKQTGNFAEAGLDVKKLFYDYKDLNVFERSVLRRMFPFYSWSRFNIPRMIETMFTRPVTHYRIGEMFRNWERQANDGAPVDERDLPEWVKNRFGIVVDKNEDGTYNIRTLDTLVPTYEAYGFFAGMGFKDKIWDLTTNSFTPIAKIPVEAIFNKSLFTGGDIEQLPGQPAKGFSYSQVGMSRRPSTEGPLGIVNLLWNEHFVRNSMRPVDFVVKFIDSLADDRVHKQAAPQIWTALMDMFMGRSYQVDPEESREAFYKDWKKTERAFLNQIKWADENNDEVSSNFFRDKLNLFRLTKPEGVK